MVVVSLSREAKLSLFVSHCLSLEGHPYMIDGDNVLVFERSPYRLLPEDVGDCNTGLHLVVYSLTEASARYTGCRLQAAGCSLGPFCL